MIRRWVPVLIGCAWAMVPGSPAAARPRWGVELGPRVGSFTASPATNPLSSDPNENRTLTTLGGGVLAEWPVSARLSVSGAIRYEESGAGVHHEVAQVFNGGTAYGLWSDEELRLRGISVAPALRVALGRGFHAGLSPDLTVVLKARRQFDLRLGRAEATFGGFAPQAVIFEQAGSSFELDVTGDYHRVLMGLSVGVSWQRELAGQLLRLEAGYHRLLADPSRSAAVDEQLQDFRAGLTWLR